MLVDVYRVGVALIYGEPDNLAALLAGDVLYLFPHDGSKTLAARTAFEIKLREKKRAIGLFANTEIAERYETEIIL